MSIVENFREIMSNFALNAGLLIGLFIVVVVLLWLFNRYYTVVPPDEAHVVVGNRGKRVYSSAKDEIGRQLKATYFYIPILMRRIIVPLSQIQIEVRGMSLHDKEVVPFKCDIVAWFVVDDPSVAAERIGEVVSDQELRRISQEEIQEKIAQRISKDIHPLVQSVARTASFKVAILDIMQDRKKFSLQVEEDIDVSLPKWGLLLTDLEILHIDDVEGQSVIANLEKREAKVIEAQTRMLVAEQERMARITEADKEREREQSVAENREIFTKRQIQADEQIAIREQEKNMTVAEKLAEANIQTIDADRQLEVGRAKYLADAAVAESEGKRLAMVQIAEGEKQKMLLDADATAAYTRDTGQAEADANQAKLQAEGAGIKAKLVGEADGRDKLADAQKKMQDSAVIIEMIYAARDVEIAKYRYLAEGITNAKTQIIAGGVTELFGNSIGPKDGAGLGATFASLLDNLPDDAKEKVKEILGTVKKEET